jgi:hypothetical protein
VAARACRFVLGQFINAFANVGFFSLLGNQQPRAILSFRQ